MTSVRYDEKGLVLGLNYSGVHDTAAALVTSRGQVLSACSLERLTRVKQDSRPPDALLRDIPWDRIDTIAVSTDEWAWSPVNPASRLHPAPLPTVREGFLAHAAPFYEYLATLPKPVRFVCHQASHAASAFWWSGFDEALCLVYDGGMFNSPWFGGLYRAAHGDGITPLDRFGSSHYAKITSLYSVVTALLGFTPNKHEGKITGLAAYGHSIPAIRAVLDELFTVDNLTMESVVEWFHGYSKTVPAVLSANPVRKRELRSRLGGHSREDIAATLQAMTEEHILEILRRARDFGWNASAICLAGGLFANVKVNQRIKESGFRDIFVAPPMTDDGTALGAALAVAAESPAFAPHPAAHMFFGPHFSSQEIAGQLHAFGLRFRVLDNPEEELATRLQHGAIVGVFQGNMEFGPRALGNRSILSRATDPEINANLNARLRRTEFMPFAPITRVEDAPECYVGLEGAQHTAEFMTITCQCTERMRSQSPAVVHVDGTARPQLVRPESNPLLHGILTAYRRQTGIASLINTSFNVHEEPIVCSPADAIRGFLETGIDYLYLEGGFFVSFEENLQAAVSWMRQALARPSQKERQLESEKEIFVERLTWLQVSFDDAIKRSGAALSEMRAQLEKAVALIGEQDERSKILEAAADERLQELQAKERALSEMRAQLEKAVALIGEQAQRSKTLEAAADTRLQELEAKERALSGMRAQLEAKERVIAALDAELARRSKP